MQQENDQRSLNKTMGRRSGLREIDKIIHYYEPWIDNKRHKVGVKMKTDSDGGKPQFYTQHFKDDQERVIYKFFDTLPELYEWIEEQLADLIKLSWEPKIYIQVKGRSSAYEIKEDNASYRGIDFIHSEVEITATILEVGTSEDGKRWRRAPGKPKTLKKFEEQIGYGLEKREGCYYSLKEQEHPGDPYSRALIDDTEENRALLQQFAIRFDELRDQFFKAFSPDYVQQFLTHAAGTLLLNAPEEK